MASTLVTRSMAAKMLNRSESTLAKSYLQVYRDLRQSTRYEVDKHGKFKQMFPITAVERAKKTIDKLRVTHSAASRTLRKQLEKQWGPFPTKRKSA